MTDWTHIRNVRFTKDPPPEWPAGVSGISTEGRALLGVHEQSGKLYWDGKELVMRSLLSLGIPRVADSLGGRNRCFRLICRKPWPICGLVELR